MSCKRNLFKNLESVANQYQAFTKNPLDYFRPILGKYYGLVIVDSYSRFPEVFWTTNSSSDFTRQAFRKYFSREGIPQVIVTDNGTHFSASSLKDWIKSIGSQVLFTAPRHPESNGLAENFVKTVKNVIKAEHSKAEICVPH